ncbi:MAG: rhodanese-like domain-containing protein, partial [Acidimicrobiales bacterium]|nr:rhodanese-like domain-containing protein [Acidimicrobiales bacterium]
MSSSITREELYRSVTSDDPIVLVEALGPGYFADAHLPGAVNIPPDSVDVLAPRLIGALDASVVVYC